MGRGTLSASYLLAALWYPNPEISDLIHVLTPWVGGWETSNFLLPLYAYTAGYRISIDSRRLLECARLSSMPRYNL
jgi:hypothetical protein